MCRQLSKVEFIIVEVNPLNDSIMSATQLVQKRTESAAVPEDVTSKGGKLVYVYLSFVVEATVQAIANALGLKHIDLLPVLASLQRAGYVERNGDLCRFAQ
jgi:DNA-binding MarR family transcriptional regulator